MERCEWDGVSMSRLGMGCAPMLGRAGRRESETALAAAWDAGINLFDVARSYGYGEAESLLGGFLRGKRDRAVVSTKFGIPPAAQEGWKQALKPVVRAALKLAPGLRGAVRRGAGTGDTSSHVYTPAVLRASLETSLRALGTDYVDLLFCHAAPVSVMAQDDLMAELGRVVTEGKARRVGLATDAPTVIAAIEGRSPEVLGAMQFPANLMELEILDTTARAKRGRVLLANHPFGGVMGMAATRERMAALAADAAVPAALREKLAAPGALADVVFSVVLRGTGVDAVVASMIRVENLRANAAAVAGSRFSDDEAAMLREYFRAG